MPPDLPGLYFDEEKKRYFPLSKKPAGASKSPTPGALTLKTRSEHTKNAASRASQRADTQVKPQKIWSVYHAARNMHTSIVDSSRRHDLHRILCAHITQKHRFTGRQTVARASLSAFCASNRHSRFVVGDADGWIYTPQVPEGALHPEQPQSAIWVAQVFLESKVSSVCMSDDITVATSFGPRSKILIRNDSSPETMFIMSPPESIYDIWTASLAGRSLVFGAHKEAVYVPDPGANSGAFVRLRTHSDVLAVAQAPHLAYAGARSGAITRFDLRAPREAGARLFAQHAEGTGAPAVTGLRVLREFELVVARIDGQLCTHDLRFATLDSSRPITALSGHVNGYATHTPLASDPSGAILFAAGTDHCIRAWSLRDGAALQGLSSPLWPDDPLPIGQRFNEPVVALEITDHPGDAGMTLRAAVGRELLEWTV